MDELQRRLMTALRRLSEQSERERTQQAAQAEVCQQQVETLRRQVERLAGQGDELDRTLQDAGRDVPRAVEMMRRAEPAARAGARLRPEPLASCRGRNSQYVASRISADRAGDFVRSTLHRDTAQPAAAFFESAVPTCACESQSTSASSASRGVSP